MAPSLPFLADLERRRVRRSLPAAIDARLEVLARSLPPRSALLAEPLALARLVAFDLETTGPRMDDARIIGIGALAIRGSAVRHDETFERLLRQARPSAVDNILVHRIGGQQQLGGEEPAVALLECLEFLGPSPIVAFRAEFDSTILSREVSSLLGTRLAGRFIDLAVLLPALFPGTQNDTLEDWLAHFRIRLRVRHAAIADAYAHAMLLLIVLDRAARVGMSTVGDLVRIERAQRWLGLRR